MIPSHTRLNPSSSFCRKTTLSKHLKRNHNGFLDEEFTGDDADEAFDDEESLSPATSEITPTAQYSRSHWGLPNVDAQLPYRQTLQRNDQFDEQPIKRESSVQPTSYPATAERTQSNSGYVNNYPHPNMMQGGIQNLTVTPVHRPRLVMQATHSNHSSYDSQMSNPRMIPRSDMSGSYSSSEQILTEPLQQSPASSTDCSPASGSRSSGEYYPTFPTSEPYPSQPSYDAPQSQVNYIQMQPTQSRHSQPMRTCDMPSQGHIQQQHQQQVDDFGYSNQSALYGMQMQREATQQAEAQRMEQQRQQEQQLQLQQMQQMQQLQQQQQQQQQRQHEASQQQFNLMPQDDHYDSIPYQEPELVVDVPDTTQYDALHYINQLRYSTRQTPLMLYGGDILGEEDKLDDVTIDGHLLPSNYAAHIF